MRFVRADKLKKGMRLAKPIYNKNGVLLYDRDTKLTKQGINSIINFKLIGIYILEPTEPLPPMSDDDIEFERLQTMSVFGLREDLNSIRLGEKPGNLDGLIKLIIKKYARRGPKVNFIQNHRSSEDYVYKHSLNVAILSALIGARLRINVNDMKNMVCTALIHDIGRLSIPEEILQKENLEKEDRITISACESKGLKLLTELPFISDGTKEMLLKKHKMQTEGNRILKTDTEYSTAVRILNLADKFDDMTAMRIGVEPVSDIVAVRSFLKDEKRYDERMVAALIDSVKILCPGTCVEMSNHTTGLVIKTNRENVLRPMVLCFNDNQIYNFNEERVYSNLRIVDIMKTLDRRIKIDQATINEYIKRYN